MEMEQRIGVFVQLGKDLLNVTDMWRENPSSIPDVWRRTMEKSQKENGWFTPENQIKALEGLSVLLSEQSLREGLAPYGSLFPVSKPKTVAVIMAGNIPAVNFADFLYVLLSGHRFVGKLSSADTCWLPFLAGEITELAPELKRFIHFETETIRDSFDAVIATGSGNTARYFEYYFGRYPHIIRKNRTSVAVLTGSETPQQREALGRDISNFYGMGCRNVSKLFVPEGYDFIPLLQTLESFTQLAENHKYVNNYEYHRSLLLLNGDPFYDNGLFLLHRNEKWGAPVGSVFYEYYTDQNELHAKLLRHEEQIQCTVAAEGDFPRRVDFGKSQAPAFSDFPDGIDVMQFLGGLA